MNHYFRFFIFLLFFIIYLCATSSPKKPVQQAHASTATSQKISSANSERASKSVRLEKYSAYHDGKSPEVKVHHEIFSKQNDNPATLTKKTGTMPVNPACGAKSNINEETIRLDKAQEKHYMNFFQDGYREFSTRVRMGFDKIDVFGIMPTIVRFKNNIVNWMFEDDLKILGIIE